MYTKQRQDKWKYWLTCWKYFDAAILLTTYINFFPVKAGGGVILETNIHFCYLSTDLIIQVLIQLQSLQTLHISSNTGCNLKIRQDCMGLHAENIQTIVMDIGMYDSFLSFNSVFLSFTVANSHTICNITGSFKCVCPLVTRCDEQHVKTHTAHSRHLLYNLCSDHSGIATN